MNLTNHQDIPVEIIRAIEANDKHVVRGDISVTQLIDSPQVRILKKIHRDKIEEDAADRLFMLLGTVMHSILESGMYEGGDLRKIMGAMEALTDIRKKGISSAVSEDAGTAFTVLADFLRTHFKEELQKNKVLYEQTMIIEVGGMTISGTCDLFRITEGALEDYKLTSTWAFIFPESKKDWERQQNIYAYMLTDAGFQVKSLCINAMFRDFSKSKIIQNKDYPPRQFMHIPLKMWSKGEQLQYIADRVALHLKAEEDGYASCSNEEMWASADAYAVMIKGKKRAHRVFPDETLAIQEKEIQDFSGKEASIQYRPGERKRCESYCPVSKFCPQFAEYKKAKEGL